MKLTLKHALSAVILVLSFGAPVAAGPLEDAVAAEVEGEYATALRLFRPLAGQGNAIAQFNLGVMYRDGLGVPQNYPEALKWFRKAADQGMANAQYNLGSMYYGGLGVSRNYLQAYMWFDIAASQFPGMSKEDRDRAVKARDFVASKMAPAQVAKAQKLAREWKPTKQPPR
jgi:TPR repeat protein